MHRKMNGNSTVMTTDSESITAPSRQSAIIDPENGIEAESRKLPSSRFKGVVPQPNGRWGSQIYERHQRVWLGTFNGEEEAARAYDTAAYRFRGRDAVVNFKQFSSEDESAFLNSRSKYEIVDMLRKHTYNDELEQSRKDSIENRAMKDKLSSPSMPVAREQLFEKSVTPSDVGKLNRLVIPKQHAEKHFPLNNDVLSKGPLLNFEDAEGKVWRFRYSYWNSSQSYVLTKGWNRFVKEKNLQAGDILRFHRSVGPDKQLHIDCAPKSGGSAIRLFGVNINLEAPPNQTEVLGFQCRKKKKQRVTGDNHLVFT